MKLSFFTAPLRRCSEKTIRNTLEPLTLFEEYGGSVMVQRLDRELALRRQAKSNCDIAMTVRYRNEPIGWTCIMPCGKKSSRLMFYVKPKYRRKGVASTLMNQTIKYLKRKGQKTAWVAAWDQRSNEFYSRHGFKTVWASAGPFDMKREL